MARSAGNASKTCRTLALLSRHRTWATSISPLDKAGRGGTTSSPPNQGQMYVRQVTRTSVRESRRFHDLKNDGPPPLTPALSREGRGRFVRVRSLDAGAS